jgi:AAA domain
MDMSCVSETWVGDAVAGTLRAVEAATTNDRPDFAIHGLLPRTGASMWFGPGSTGKTQLLLWMAAHLAARAGTGPTHWLNAEICRRGHIVVLSAEDLREHLYLRINGIVKALKAQYPDLDVEEVCGRIHVFPFLSFSEEEFAGSNPSLFRGRRNNWRPSPTMRGVEEFIDAWNGSAPVGDKIVGVIMDSAVSMAGFELSDSEATTDFLFRVNRVSHRQGVFWAIVGHTPKSAAIKDNDPLDGAVERLRGSAMWSTTPRTVVELRIAGETERLGEVQRAYPELGRRDIVIAAVVKANSKHADFKPRVLRRLEEGAFEDLTELFPSVCKAWDPTAPTQQGPAGNDARLSAVASLINNITDGGEAGRTFTREQLQEEFIRTGSTYVALTDVIGDAQKAKENSREFLSYWLKALSGTGAVKLQRSGTFLVKDLTGFKAAA